MSLMSEIRPDLEEMIANISQRNTFYGNKIPESIMRQFEIEEKETSIGVLVPYWLPVVEHGRGPRRSTKNHGLIKIIYEWMRRRNMFSVDDRQRTDERSRFMTWYINKYGNKQFR